MTPVAAAQVRSGSPKGGVYLFSEGRVNLYVGRTKRHIHVRIRDHFGANRDGCGSSSSTAQGASASGTARATWEPVEGVVGRAAC